MSWKKNKQNNTRGFGTKFLLFFAVFFLGTAVFSGVNLFLEHQLELKRKPGADDPVRKENEFFLNKLDPKRYPVVIYGDSRTYRGVVPDVFRKKWQLPCMNYALSSGGINDEMLRFLDSRLDTGSGRAAVILGITPYDMSADSRENKQFHVLQKQRTELDAGGPGILSVMLGNFSEARLKKIRRSLRKNRKEAEVNIRQTFYPDGWCETESVSGETVPEMVKSALASYEAIFRQTKYSQQSEKELLHWIRTWKKRGIEVYLFRLPASSEMIDLENRLSGFQEEEFSRKVEEAGGHFIRCPLTAYPSYDASHLASGPAREMTEELCRRIESIHAR